MIGGKSNVTQGRREKLWPVVLLVPALASAGCASHTQAASVAVPVIPAGHALRMDLHNEVTLTAELEPFYEVDVMAKEAGYIRHMKVDIGDRVKAGQLICMLDIPELQDDLQRATADVATATAQRSAAEQDQKRAMAAEAIAHLSYSRILDVSKKEPGLVPLQEVDVAHSRDLEAEAQVSAAGQNVQAAGSHLQAAKAELAHETALVDYTRIVSPLNGIVTRRYASDGAMIQAGIASNTQAMPVVHIAQNDVLRLMLPVPEEYVGTIHDGESVTITVPALNRSLPGKVTRFSDLVQPSTRTMTAEVDLKNPGLQLVPGMYAQVQLGIAEAPHAVAVPVAAIDGTGAASRVFTVDDRGTVHVRTVKTGIQTPQFVEIVSGIQSGETVLLGGRSGLEDGETVQPHFE